MKYYSEEDAGDIRQTLEKDVLKWPKVTTKKMFGCPCYKVDGKLFSFVVTRGIVITKLSEDELEAFATKHDIGPFVAGKMTTKKWARIEIEKTSELKKIIPYVKKSFENAKKVTKK
jgi:predicted DNA-binding protein (MmcQ/YjbR family)